MSPQIADHLQDRKKVTRAIGTLVTLFDCAREAPIDPSEVADLLDLVHAELARLDKLEQSMLDAP